LSAEIALDRRADEAFSKGAEPKNPPLTQKNLKK
jgi:hypothetical protein